MSDFFADDVTSDSFKKVPQTFVDLSRSFLGSGNHSVVQEFDDAYTSPSSHLGLQGDAGVAIDLAIDLAEANSTASQNAISTAALAAPWISVPRSQFQLENLAIFYGTVEVSGGTPIQTVRNWDFDTIIVANRLAYNGLGADTYYNQGAMNNLRTDTTQDVLAYVNVGKVDKNLETYTNASAADAWFGGQTFDANGAVIPNVNFANYWQAGWLEKLVPRGYFSTTSAFISTLLSPVEHLARMRLI
jgi:hypothetical protein